MVQSLLKRIHVSRRAALLGVVAHAPAFLSGCTSFVFAAANFPALFGSYHAQRDVKYGTLKRQLLDVYVPSGAGTTRPIVMFVHGGGWTSGSKNSYQFVAESLTARGFVAVLPNYRLYPEAKFPDFVHDVAQALAWTHAHAEEFGGDPGQIFLMGHSAGAHIGALVTFDQSYLSDIGASSTWIKGFIGLAGPYDFLPFKEAYLRDVFGPEEQYPRSQPVNFIDDAATQLPPTLLIHGEADQTVWLSNSKSLAARLRAHGARVIERYYPLMNHADVMAAFSLYYRGRRELLNEVDGFVRAHAARITTAATLSVDFAR